ncbi:MAG TPA: hypothetical protein PKL31_13145 [Fulvivirga sp.]|nr:hypothetical protein [Fulvivirga sp.]
MSQLAEALDSVDVLECENEENIILGFMDRYDVSHEEAKDIFEETKKWLYLASQSEEESVFIDQPLLIIDEMWHTFILHTKQYYNFCLRNFKKIIHHLPTLPQEKEAYQLAYETNPSLMMREHENKMKKQFSLIYDHLGAETLLKWYDTIPQKYTPDYIKSIKKA